MSIKYIGKFSLDEEELEIEFESKHNDVILIKNDALEALIEKDPMQEFVVTAIGQLAEFSFNKI